MSRQVGCGAQRGPQCNWCTMRVDEKGAFCIARLAREKEMMTMTIPRASLQMIPSPTSQSVTGWDLGGNVRDGASGRDQTEGREGEEGMDAPPSPAAPGMPRLETQQPIRDRAGRRPIYLPTIPLIGRGAASKGVWEICRGAWMLPSLACRSAAALLLLHMSCWHANIPARACRGRILGPEGCAPFLRHPHSQPALQVSVSLTKLLSNFRGVGFCFLLFSMLVFTESFCACESVSRVLEHEGW